MEVPWLPALLLPLVLQILPCRSLPDLTCFSDYIRNISCIWNGTGVRPGERCVLREERGRGKSCDLTPTEGLGHGFRTCQLVFNEVSGYYYKVNIKVTCEGSDLPVAGLKEYRPALNVKMHPPSEPVIAKANISWSLGSPHSRMIRDYHFELQFKPSEELWESPNAVSRNLLDRQMSAELAEDDLERGRLYEARVRVRPTETSGNSLKGVWSTWSPTALWRSEVGRSLVIDTSSSFPGMGPELQVTLGLVTAAVAVMVLITCKYHRAGWIHKLKLQHVPNPSTYFLPLSSVHGGNFQKWLRPMFTPESFEVPQSFEDVSAVQVFKAEDASALLHGSSPTDLWDGSAGSSCFSNMGYFYSDYPGSYAMEVCPVYFSHSSDAERCSEQPAGREGDDPVPADSSYEQLSDPPGEAGQLDPDRREWNEGEQEEKEEEGDVNDADPPLAILPFSLPVPVTPAPVPPSPHLPSTPPPPLPSHDFDTGSGSGSNNTSGPLEGTLGRSSSERIEPSAGGYMSVMEMMNTYCNKSI